MLTIFAGLAAGAAHVISGPDHLAALAPIAVDEPRRALAIGTRWGLGHGTGVVLLGGLGVVARDFIDIDIASGWAEFSVGFVLIGVGIWALIRSRALVIHDHVHVHEHIHGDVAAKAHPHDGSLPGADEAELAAHVGGAAVVGEAVVGEAARRHGHAHEHMHVHVAVADHEAPEAHGGHGRTAFLVGLLHGAAGGGHLLGVLPSLALPREAAAVYLAAYFVAAVVAMAGFGALLGAVVRRVGPAAVRGMMVASSGAAIVVGFAWLAMGWPT